MRIAAHKLSAELPAGWDGRIWERRVRVGAGHPAAPRAAEPAAGAATLHAANFALPARDGDFGTAATASMAAGRVFVSLTEYVEGGGLRAGHGLFASRRAPRRLRESMFSSRTLLLARPGQRGCQRFFSRAGRPFCLYVVLSHGRAERLLPQVNALLRSIDIEIR